MPAAEKKKRSASTVSKDAAKRACAAKELLGLPQGSLRASGWIKAKCSLCFMRRLLDPNTDQCTECVGATDDDIFVLVGALLAVVVFLIGIRQSLVEEDAAASSSQGTAHGKAPTASR